MIHLQGFSSSAMWCPPLPEPTGLLINVKLMRNSGLSPRWLNLTNSDEFSSNFVKFWLCRCMCLILANLVVFVQRVDSFLYFNPQPIVFMSKERTAYNLRVTNKKLFYQLSGQNVCLLLETLGERGLYAANSDTPIWYPVDHAPLSQSTLRCQSGTWLFSSSTWKFYL